MCYVLFCRRNERIEDCGGLLHNEPVVQSLRPLHADVGDGTTREVTDVAESRHEIALIQRFICVCEHAFRGGVRSVVSVHLVGRLDAQ